MKYILLWIAVGSSPAQLGVYNNYQSCREAIRAIYVRQMLPFPEQVSDDVRKKIEEVVDIQMKWDTKYQCQPEKK